MAGYKNYRKNKLKKYQKGGAVRGQEAAPPDPAFSRMGRRATDSPYEPRDLFPKGYEARWMGVRGGAQGGPQAPNMPGGIDYSSVTPWNPPDEPLYKKGGKVMPQYKKGGKVMDQYLKGKKGKKKSKKKKAYAKGGSVTKDGGQIELIKSMRGMSLRELMDLNKKMARG